MLEKLIKAVVVAQLVERSLPTPEIRGLKPDIGKIKSTRKDKNEENRPGMAHLLKKGIQLEPRDEINIHV